MGKKIGWGRVGWTGQKKEKRMRKKRWVKCDSYTLRGPAAMAFYIARSYCKTLSCLFLGGGGGGIAQLSRDNLQHGVSHRCALMNLSAKGAVSHHFGGVLS